MAYMNGNPYRDEITEVWCDKCFGKESANFDTYTYPDGYVHRHQKAPWVWSPVWSLDPQTKDRCPGCGAQMVGAR